MSLGHKICLENIAAKLRDSLEQQPPLSPEIHQAVSEFSELCKRGTITLQEASKKAPVLLQQILKERSCPLADRKQSKQENCMPDVVVQGVLNLVERSEKEHVALPDAFKKGLERFRNLVKQGTVTYKDTLEMMDLHSLVLNDPDLLPLTLVVKCVLELIQDAQEKYSPLPDAFIKEVEAFKSLVDQRSVTKDTLDPFVQSLEEFLDSQQETKRFQLKTNPDHRRQLYQEIEKILKNFPNFSSARTELERLCDLCDSCSYASMIYFHVSLKQQTQFNEELAQRAMEARENKKIIFSLQQQHQTLVALEQVKESWQESSKSTGVSILMLLSGLKEHPDFLSEELLHDMLKADLPHEKLNSLLAIAVSTENLSVIKQLLEHRVDYRIVPEEIWQRFSHEELEQCLEQIDPFGSLMKIDNLELFKIKLDQINPQTLEKLVSREENLSRWISSNIAFALTLATHTNCTPSLQKRLFELGSRVYKNALLFKQPAKLFLSQHYSQDMIGWSGAFFGKVYDRLKKASIKLPAEVRFRQKLLADMQAHIKQKKEDIAWQKACLDQLSEEHIDELDEYLR